MLLCNFQGQYLNAWRAITANGQCLQLIVEKGTNMKVDETDREFANELFLLAIQGGIDIALSAMAAEIAKSDPQKAARLTCNIVACQLRYELSGELDEAERRGLLAQDALDSLPQNASRRTLLDLIDALDVTKNQVRSIARSLEEAMKGAPDNDKSLEEDFEQAREDLIDAFAALRSTAATADGDSSEQRLPEGRKLSGTARSRARKPKRPASDSTITESWKNQTGRRTGFSTELSA
jgi:hypothetical protein